MCVVRDAIAVTARIRSGWVQVTGLFPHCHRCFLAVARKGLWRMCIRSSMLDGSETWSLKGENEPTLHRAEITRSSADADNRLDAFSGQSRSTNMVPFHMLHIVSYCVIVTLSLRRAVFTIFDFKKCRALEIGIKGH